MNYSVNAIKKNYEEWVGKYNDGLISDVEFISNLHNLTSDALKERLAKLETDRSMILDALTNSCD